MLDATLVVGFELDTEALEVCQQNIVEHEVKNIDLVQCDVLTDVNQKYDLPSLDIYNSNRDTFF